MKILIACEMSGAVRSRLREKGHDAWSVDLLPSEDNSPNHLIGDLTIMKMGGFPILKWKWDMLIGFPPCTHLALSGARWLTDHWVKRKNKPARWHDGSAKRASQKEAVEFFKALWNVPIERIALENPMSMASTLVAPKTQAIQPWQFGHGERKTTWLWLKNLPKLKPTNIVEGREQRIWKMPPGENRSIDRSRTFPGIAQAMADQWGNL